MQHVILILPVLAPIVFWAAYHYHKDHHLPEPPGNLLLCLLLGVIAAAISKGLYLALEPIGLRLDAVALAEEKNVKIGIENCPMLFTADEWPGGKNLAHCPAGIIDTVEYRFCRRQKLVDQIKRMFR